MEPNKNPESSKPLYRVLDEQRNQGEWSYYRHTHGTEFKAAILNNHANEICKFYWQETQEKESVIPDTKAAANAQYTALAVNNLSPLAEMLEKIYNIEDAAFGLKGFDVVRLKSEIKEVLTKIS